MKSAYFLGAGGIGMSALERYFLSKGWEVAGYDRTPTALTEDLCKEGVDIHYEDNPELIPPTCKDKAKTLVVYTPAIPDDHKELAYFRAHGFEVKKRAAVLGQITREEKGLCVAGTHGKTTTSSMTAHLLNQSHVGCNAFLGGITKNYGTNYLLSPTSPYTVIEADEFDRSFHHLRPFATVITSADADHLDIYNTEEAYLESFRHYTSLVQEKGFLIVHRGLKFKENPQAGVTCFDYSRKEGDFHAENIRIGGSRIVFDFVSPFGNIADIELGVPVSINIDNGIAAMALAQIAGVKPEEIREGMKSFRGVQRRFDFSLKTDRHVLLSDYAHHPAEISQSIRSIREVFTGRKISGIFQPHLYSRTRDFYEDFAQSLSLLDEVILTEIYPAREAPIPGVTSRLVFDKLRPEMEKSLIPKEALFDYVKSHDFEVLMVIGAGDIDNYAPGLKALLETK